MKPENVLDLVRLWPTAARVRFNVGFPSITQRKGERGERRERETSRNREENGNPGFSVCVCGEVEGVTVGIDVPVSRLWL